MDDLSVLLSVGVRLVEVVGLVHYCRQLTMSGGLLPVSSAVCLLARVDIVHR